jgi:hypothetical protein
MKRLPRIFASSLILLLLSFSIATPVLAIPTLPSSFWGTVKINGANVPDGTSIKALVGEQVYGEGVIETHQGESYYSLGVRGDDAGTPTLDGAVEGDTIRFKVGSQSADQTAVWHTGTNINLNLSVNSSSTNNEENGAHQSASLVVVIFVMVVLMLMVFVFRSLRKK